MRIYAVFLRIYGHPSKLKLLWDNFRGKHLPFAIGRHCYDLRTVRATGDIRKANKLALNAYSAAGIDGHLELMEDPLALVHCRPPIDVWVLHALPTCW